MKNIILILALAFIFSGCQKDIIDYDTASQKAEMFLTANLNSGLDKKFVASTIDEIAAPISPVMSKAMEVKFNHQNSPWQEAIKAIDELIIPLTQRDDILSAEERYDLEQLINSSRSILDKADDSVEKATVGARYLHYLLAYSEPVDLHILTDLYKMSDAVLDDEKREMYRDYILRRAVSTLKGPVPAEMPPTRYDVLKWQSHLAIDALQGNSL